MPKLPATLLIFLCLLLCSAGWPQAAVAQDDVLDLIAQEKDGTAAGFTGGFGNIIGFRRTSASNYVIFYSADETGTSDTHALTRAVDGDASWDFTYDNQGQLIAVADNAGNRLSITHGSGGSLSYLMTVLDGFATRSIRGNLGATARAEREPDARAGQTTTASGKIEVPVRVRACESWPGRPLDVTLSYDFGQGTRAHPVQFARQSAQVLSYNHTIEPLQGIRSDAKAIALVTNKYPGGVSRCGNIARTLKAICATIPSGPPRSACDASWSAYRANCSFKPRFEKAIGNHDAGNIRGNLPDTLNVTGEAFYLGPQGGIASIAVSKQYQWNQPSQQLLIELPCWNVFQGDFSKTARFSANGGQCKPNIDLGKRARLIMPVDKAQGPPLVRFDYFKTLHERPGCFIGTFVSDYELSITARERSGHIKASLTQSPPFEEIYSFDLDLAADKASGTFRFQMHHVNDHTADITIPIRLDRVIAR